MKSKLLFTAAFGALLATAASCSDDPKNDYETGQVYEIRQVLLTAENNNNGSAARTSENSASGEASIVYSLVDANGNSITTADGAGLATEVTFVKPTNAIIAAAGDNITFTFTPGNIVLTEVTLTFPGGETAVLNAENPTCDWVATDFVDGDRVKALRTYNDKGNTYNYTGDIYLWHYHEVEVAASCAATGSTAITEEFNFEANAVVENVALEGGQPVYDENGSPVIVPMNVLTVKPGDTVTLTYAPTATTDVCTLTFPDGTEVELSAQTATCEWTANEFADGASISAKLVIPQGNITLEFTQALQLVKP